MLTGIDAVADVFYRTGSPFAIGARLSAHRRDVNA